MLGTQEDESTAISELQRVPQEHIQQLAVIYSHLFSQNLQTDFITYVSSSEWDAIKYLFD
jgi:flagellar biosynthesis chaperone FliJ